MITNYQQAVNWIHSRLRLGIKPGLARMEWLLEKLDNPHKLLKSIHIGGTNGKGSTVTYLRNILQEEGYTVGTFTSPYFERFNERISINGQPLSDEDLVTLVNMIKPLAEELEMTEWGSPSEFEIITAISFYYFAKMSSVDIALYEVGLGGRLDSTNVITPIVSIITNVGFDHIQFLGNRLEDIAFEKAGIIKHRIPVITAVNQESAIHVINQIAVDRDSEVLKLNDTFKLEYIGGQETGEVFHYQSDMINETFEISMVGEHQTRNAALAIQAIELLNRTGEYAISKSAIHTGLQKAFWPGRMEKVSNEPVIYLDGAHNPEGIQALINTVKKRFRDIDVRILFTALKDKELRPMIAMLEEIADELLFTSFDFPRAASANELFTQCQSDHKQIVEDWEQWISRYIQTSELKSVLIITGSLYFLSEVKPKVVRLLENHKKLK